MSYQFSNITSHSDETFLEFFVESLIASSYPNEIRRVLEHLKYLNSEGDAAVEEWRGRQDDCLKGVRRAMMELYGIAEGEANGDVKKACVDVLAEDSDYEEVDMSMSAVAGTKRKRDDRDVTTDTTCATEKSEVDETDAVKIGNDSNNDEHDAGDEQKQEQSAHIPTTTEEILSHLTTNNPQIIKQHNEISQMYKRLKQLSSERIQTAHQLRGMVDMALGRLNRDLEAFEKELGIVNETSGETDNEKNPSSVSSSSAPPLAAVAPAASSATLEKSNLQKSVSDKSNNRNSTHKTNLRRASTTTSSTATNRHPAILSRSNSVALPIPPSAGSLASRPKDLAAIQVLPNSSEWILAKILSYDKSNKMYTLSDEDVTEDKVYNIPSSRVVVLNKTFSYARGERVYAVYPDTTSFYPATVRSSKNNFVMVYFKDDSDEHGVTHEKAVPVWLVMRVPLGR